MSKKINELQSAELKYRAFLNKRDEINDQAAVLRSERDSLHENKRGLQGNLLAARDKRTALVTEMRVHKSRRDELQAKAKELIEFKKKLKGTPLGDLREEIRGLEKQIKEIELRHQTVPLKIPQERALLEDLKRKLSDLERLKKVFDEQEKIQKEVKSVDQSIDALFKQADKEHEEVVRLSTESQKFHDQVVLISKEIALLTAAANKKHEEYVKLKSGADAAHQRAVEMREKIIEIKRQKREEVMAERKAVREVNIATKKALDDEGKKDKAADDALKTLLKRGKLEMT